MNTIEIENLQKSYGKKEAVKGIGFNVARGEFFAFLGQNGAGKSTTINILTTCLSFDGGKATICGHSLGRHNNEIRKDIGIVFQNSVLDDALSVKDNINTRAAFYDIPNYKRRFEYLTEELGLTSFFKQRYGTLSGGQRRKADIARALINTPKIIFLDEPTTGLDPSTRVRVWQILKKFRQEEAMTIFLTTHYMEEAEQADRIGIIEQGEILELDTPQQLKTKYSYDTLILVIKNAEKIENYLKLHKIEYKITADTAVVKTLKSIDTIKVLKALEPYIDSFEVIKGNMDNVFLNIIKRDGEEKSLPAQNNDDEKPRPLKKVRGEKPVRVKRPAAKRLRTTKNNALS
jgi:multidrug/hemolysin transport system ATP-binding protein